METRDPQQVGGTHYQSRYQHWDLMADYEVPYLEGTASKYVVRWHRKGTELDDRRKCLTYLQKALDRWERAYVMRALRVKRPRVLIPLEVIGKFRLVNDLTLEQERMLSFIHGLDNYYLAYAQAINELSEKIDQMGAAIIDAATLAQRGDP